MLEQNISSYEHFGKCVFLTNGTIELAASLEFGPRVLRFALKDEPNVLYEQPGDAAYLCTEAGWRVYGGLRLAMAPESEKSYFPDNAPVEYELLSDGLLLTQVNDGYLNISKRIRIQFTDEPDSVFFYFEILNNGVEPIFGSPWAITAVKPGGVLHIPFFSNTMNTFPNRFISLWGNTSLADERLKFSDTELTISYLPLERYFKMGINCPKGFAQYDICGQSFTKHFEYNENARYPDNNVNLEVYCCKHMIEIESLGPLCEILPCEAMRHEEKWTLI